MLIGSNHYWEFVTGETVGGSEGPVAVRTSIGRVLLGLVDATRDFESTTSFTTTRELRVEGVTNQDLDNALCIFWDLESLGIQAPDRDPVLDQFASSIEMKEGRYEVSLLWREHHEPLPDTYNLSQRMLHDLLRWLKQEPDVLCEYDSIV